MGLTRSSTSSTRMKWCSVVMLHLYAPLRTFTHLYAVPFSGPIPSPNLTRKSEPNRYPQCLRLLRWDPDAGAIATSPEMALPIVTVPGEHDATVGGARRAAAIALGLNGIDSTDVSKDTADGDWAARVHLIHLVGVGVSNFRSQRSRFSGTE